MKNLQPIANQINNFPFYHEMSEDQSIWSNGYVQRDEVKEQLAELTNSELIELKSMLTAREQDVMRYFADFFKDLEPEPVAHNPKSIIFKNAWYYFHKGIYFSFAECLKAAWKAYKALKSLSSGIVSLTYRKATGEIRRAKGTLNTSMFSFSGKGVRKESKPDAIKYYDLEKGAWRMFRIERLINVAA